MQRLDTPPADSVFTKLACVVKPSGKLRLIDDLRRSGVNERLKCTETIALPGLMSAALMIHHMTAMLRNTSDDLVWIETDIAAAFRHVPVALEDRKYLLNEVGGILS